MFEDVSLTGGSQTEGPKNTSAKRFVAVGDCQGRTLLVARKDRMERAFRKLECRGVPKDLTGIGALERLSHAVAFVVL